MNRKLRMIKPYLKSIKLSFQNRGKFDDVRTFCMFIGYPGSGHSLIGALLDAHPNIIIAHELNALQYIASGFKRKQIYSLLLKKSHKEASQIKSGYLYNVPSQHPGRFKKLQVIGDKSGGENTYSIKQNACIYNKLKKIIKDDIKIIHVVRNPYDNISTLFKRNRLVSSGSKRFILRKIMKGYLKKVKFVDSFIKSNQEIVFNLWHEEFIKEPKLHLKKLCDFLGVEAPKDYLNDCARIVYKKPHKSRYEVLWNKELVDEVAGRIKEFDFLKHYTYDQ